MAMILRFTHHCSIATHTFAVITTSHTQYITLEPLFFSPLAVRCHYHNIDYAITSLITDGYATRRHNSHLLGRCQLDTVT